MAGLAWTVRIQREIYADKLVRQALLLGFLPYILIFVVNPLQKANFPHAIAHTEGGSDHDCRDDYRIGKDI